MAVQRDKRNGQWRYRKVVRLPNGTKVRISGMPSENTKLAAQDAERAHIKRALDPVPLKKEVPTFAEWFSGRFWREWVVANRNKPSEVESKLSIYKHHLDSFFGRKRLDEIDVALVSEFRAGLIEKELSEKRINNILAVLSKPLKYAAEVREIAVAPRVGLFKVERPEIEAWELDEYAAILVAAADEGPEWYAGACLAGEAGLRIGEVRALRWEEDVDLVARSITVNRQTRKGIEGTPKGRTRRTIPMTDRLWHALRSLEFIRRGFVVRNRDGEAKTDGETTHAIYRVCKRAGLPARAWHTLRHSFGTHAALFGVNPWRLMMWMGHKRIDETMIYVNLTSGHTRPIPDEINTVGAKESDPDRRVLAMLSQRGNLAPTTPGQVASSEVIPAS